MARLRQADGYMLTELLVAMSAGIVVFGAVLSFVLLGLRQHDVTAKRVTALDASSVGFERMQRELRQALEVDPVPPTATPVTTGVVRARVWVRAGGAAAQHWIRYDCTVASSCTRWDETAGGAAEAFVDNLTTASGAQTFTLTRATPPSILPSIAITLSRTIEDAPNPIQLTSTVTPRGCQDGLPAGNTVCPG